MRRAVAMGVIVLCCGLAGAGSVRTFDGKGVQGIVKLDDAGARVSPKIGAPVKVGWDEILHLLVSDGAAPEPPKRAVVLRDGTLIAVERIDHLGETSVKFYRNDLRDVRVARSRVARLYFRPISPDMRRSLDAGSAGVVMKNGDLYEGDVRAVDGNRISVSSVLFGNSSFDLSDQAAAAILSPVGEEPCEYVVHLTDGSALRCASIASEKGKLVCQQGVLGRIPVDYRSIREIQYAGRRLRSLAELRPSNISAAAGIDPGYQPNAVVASPVDQSPRYGIGLGGGGSITYDLGGQYILFTATAGAAAGLAPLARLQFVVLGDGRELYRGEPITSVDDPLNLTVAVAKVRNLTLRIETPEPLLGARGVWADPLLLKQ